MAHTPYPQTDRELMRLIERSPGHRAGYKQLIRELGLGGGRERRLLLEQLARITARGELVKTDSEQWSLPAATPEKTKRVKRDGFEAPVEHRATRDRLVAGRLSQEPQGWPREGILKSYLDFLRVAGRLRLVRCGCLQPVPIHARPRTRRHRQ